MRPVQRIGDKTQGECEVGSDCCPHGRNGTNAVGAISVTVNSRCVHRVADKGNCNCPHGGMFETVSGSKSVTAMGQAVSRLADKDSCCDCGLPGIHQGGSDNVTCGG